MKKIIAIYSLIKDEQVKEMQDLASNYRVLLHGDLTDEDFANIEIIFGWRSYLASKFDEGQLSSLKWIQKETAGLDKIPDRIRNNEDLLISNMKGIHAVPITENVFGYILGVARGIFTSIDRQVDRHWDKSFLNDLFSLKDKTIVIYGTGKIGQELAKTAKFFNMKTVGINTDGRQVDYFDENYQFEESYKHLKSAKFVVSSLPDIPSTNNIFNLDFFGKMSPQAYFVNIGRGATVDEAGLKEALDSGEIVGAYIDVTQIEPLPQESNLWDTSGLIISPHISGTIEHFRDDIYQIYKKNLISYLESGQLAVNEYNRQKGY